MHNLIQNIDKIHTTQMGIVRIKKNTGLFEHFYQKSRENIYDEIINFCREVIKNTDTKITVRGKNYYIEHNNIIWTVNRGSFTIITAHKKDR